MARGAAWRLSRDPDEVARLVAALDASVNVALLRELARERRGAGEGWLYLSQLAERLGEAPGTVGAAVQKLGPLVEEKREKGLRYFRATVTEVTILVAPASRARAPRRPRRDGVRG